MRAGVGGPPTLQEIRKAHSGEFQRMEYERPLILNRYVFRPVAFLLTWVAIRMKLSSESISWLSGVVGLVGCILLTSGSKAPVSAGLWMLIFFNLLDCVDGDIARTMRTGNPYGRFLDSVCGGVIDLAFWGVVGILGFRHPALLRYPEGFGHGPLFWLGVGGATCLLAVTLGYLERTYDELLKEPWNQRQRALPARTADAGSQKVEGPATVMLRHLSRNLRVRETHYVLLLIAWWIRAVDLLLVAYLAFYAVYVLLSLALYTHRGRVIKATWPGSGV